MNYCTEELGMNQPLTIQPNQVTSSPPSDQTTPSGDINPTTTTPGLNFSSPNPQINITFDQPASLTVIYLPVDRPNQPTNVDQFTVVFVYPNGTTSQQFTSEIPSTGSTTTTTPSTGAPSETTTTPSPSGIVPPSDVSPQVDLPTNFQVPNGTIVVINITSTTDKSNPSGVCTILFSIALILYTQIETDEKRKQKDNKNSEPYNSSVVSLTNEIECNRVVEQRFLLFSEHCQMVDCRMYKKHSKKIRLIIKCHCAIIVGFESAF
jgi:hypothetical protein